MQVRQKLKKGFKLFFQENVQEHLHPMGAAVALLGMPSVLYTVTAFLSFSLSLSLRHTCTHTTLTFHCTPFAGYKFKRVCL